MEKREVTEAGFPLEGAGTGTAFPTGRVNGLDRVPG